MIDNRRLSRFCLAPNGYALAMVGQFITFCWNVCSLNEKKADEMHVSPAIANALVSCFCFVY